MSPDHRDERVDKVESVITKRVHVLPDRFREAEADTPEMGVTLSFWLC